MTRTSIKDKCNHGPLQQCEKCEIKSKPCPDCGCVGLHGCVGKRPHGLYSPVPKELLSPEKTDA